MAIKFDTSSEKALVHGAEQKVSICAGTEAIPARLSTEAVT